MSRPANSLLLAAVLFPVLAFAQSDGPARPANTSEVKFLKHRIGSLRSEAFGVADFNGDGRLDIVAGDFLYLAPDFKPLKIRSVKGKVDEHGKGYFNDFMNAPVDLEHNHRPGVVSVDWFSQSVYYYRNTLGQPGDWPETIVDTADNYECGDLVDLEGTGKANILLTHTRQTVWYEQVRNGNTIAWKQHTIDDTWTQAHALTLADLDRCGLPELITGKRFMAHNGSDPDEYGKLGLYYYKLIRKPDKLVEWQKHVISYDEGIGAGLAIWAGDFRDAGACDIIVTGKFGGPVWFENKGK
jgi:hypothetical protein